MGYHYFLGIPIWLRHVLVWQAWRFLCSACPKGCRNGACAYHGYHYNKVNCNDSDLNYYNTEILLKAKEYLAFSLIALELYDTADLLVRQSWPLNPSWQPFIHVPSMWLHGRFWKQFPHNSELFSPCFEGGQATQKRTKYMCNL